MPLHEELARSTWSLRKYTSCALLSLESKRHSSNSNRVACSGVQFRDVTPFPATTEPEDDIAVHRKTAKPNLTPPPRDLETGGLLAPAVSTGCRQACN